MRDVTDEHDFRFGASYDQLIESMEVEEVLRVDEVDYQGSSWVIVKQGDRYGLLVYGWGLCSGCDAAAAARTKAAAEELRDDLWSGIVWRESAAELADYIETEDKDLKWYGNCREYPRFRSDALRMLRAN